MSSTLRDRLLLHSTAASCFPPSSPNGLSASNSISRPEFTDSDSAMFAMALSPGEGGGVRKGGRGQGKEGGRKGGREGGSGQEREGAGKKGREGSRKV